MRTKVKNRKRDRRMFKNTAERTRKANLDTNIMHRGGIHL